MKTKSTKHLQGFSLIEILVVIAIIGILAGLLFPVIQKAIVKAKMTDTLNNGANIHAALVMAETSGHSIYPKSSGPGSFATSTDYFKYLVENRILDVTFDFFAAGELTPCNGLDPSKFTADNNAWCIVADINATSRNMTPILFTKNLDISTLSDSVAGALTDTTPYGKQGVIVLDKNGKAVIYKEDELPDMFNAAKAGNKILRP